MIEYNILLLLLRRGFDYLPLEKLLTFAKYLIKIALNIDMHSMSILADVIESTFYDKIIGNTIGMELRRGMSRDVLFFKLILIIHSITSDEQKLQKELSEDPKLFLFETLEKHLNCYSQLPADLSIEEIAELIQKETMGIFNQKLITDSFAHNYPLLKDKLETDYLLKDFMLPDILLEDQETTVIPSKRIDFDLHGFFNECLDSILKYENGLQDVYKFHMNPVDANIRDFLATG